MAADFQPWLARLAPGRLGRRLASNILANLIQIGAGGTRDIDGHTFIKQAGSLSCANLFAFGIGSSVNRELIESVARAGGGEPAVVTCPSEAAAAARRFRPPGGPGETTAAVAAGRHCGGLAAP